jgi:hypothetical protein
VSVFLVWECLDLFGRRADARESAFMARNRRRPEALAGFPHRALPPEDPLNPEWTRPASPSQSAAFNRIVAENWEATIQPDTTLTVVDPPIPEGEDDIPNFQWGNPLGEERAAGPEPAQAPPPPPPPPQEPPPPPPPPQEPAPQYLQRPADPYVPPRESAQMYDLHADVRDLVRMSRTMLDTLAAQLKQNEESARLVTGHLGSTESQLANLSDRLRSLGETVAQPSPIALDSERLAHSVRRIEARLQALVEDVQRQTSGQGGDVARVVEQTAAIRDRQSDLTSTISELTSAQDAIQANIAALRNEQLAAARSIESDLGSVAEHTSSLRQSQAELTAALSEQAAALRSLQADLGQAGAGGGAVERQMGTLVDKIRQAVAEELRRESTDGSGIGAAVSEQASTLRMLQGDLTSILSDQAAAIRSLQASMTGEVQRADLERLRNDLFSNQERQFANIVGVIRTLLHDSDELVLAMGRVPKSDRAGRAFDMLRLSGGSGAEGRESQP